MQVAEALGKAHRMGIVHRDLKPANVMITKSGAKLLDFGLAKSKASIVDVDDATRQKALTQEGTILGTFQYMAPEQLEGQEADARTDIFALGALLYEMATGPDETGRAELFVQTWPLSDEKWQISFTGGDQPFWRGDGKELFYLAADGKMMSVQADLASRSFADPVVLFQTPLTPVSITGNRNQYLVPRDGQRFLLLESPNSAPTHLTLVQNFSRLLEK